MLRHASVLVVEDEFLIVEILTMMLMDMGLDVCASAASADEAVAMVERHHPQLVLMDIRLKGRKDGVDAATAIQQRQTTPIIFITGSREPETVARIEHNHPAALLFKPVRFNQLQKAVLQAIA